MGIGRGSLLGKTTGVPLVYRWFVADPAEMTHSSSSFIAVLVDIPSPYINVLLLIPSCITVLFSLAVQSILDAIVLLHRSSLLHPLSSSCTTVPFF